MSLNLSLQAASWQKIIFILLLIFLPSQLGWHFWPSWAYIRGVRIDYFSPTLYFTDILVLGLFLLWTLSLRTEFKKNYLKKIVAVENLIVLILLGFYILLNIYFSWRPWVSLYKWVKITELGFLAYFTALVANRDKKIWFWLTIPILYSSFLAIWQFINQGSVGGIWYWLGERSFTKDTLGIANAVINGQYILRPYATFPHPNVLAGFLFVSISLLFIYFPHFSRKFTALLILVSIFVFWTTLSKGDLVVGWQLRQQLNEIAWQQWQQSPLIGTGLGTSPLYSRNITNFAMLYQPIHNIYWLLLSETGIIGLGLFLILIIKLLKHLFQTGNVRFQIPLLIILFLGIFDHYWLTLQQSQLLLAVVVGIIIGDYAKVAS